MYTFFLLGCILALTLCPLLLDLILTHKDVRPLHKAARTSAKLLIWYSPQRVLTRVSCKDFQRVTMSCVLNKEIHHGQRERET